MEMYYGLANLRPCPEHYCENLRARVCWKEMAQSPMSFFKAEDLPQGILLRDPSHLRQEEVFTLWEFWTSRQKDGLVGLIFSGCDPWDKRKDMGKKLTCKAKGIQEFSTLLCDGVEDARMTSIKRERS